MRKIVMTAGLAALLAAAGAGLAEDKRADKGAAHADKAAAAKLEGGYTIVAGEENGEPVPGPRIQGALVRFTAEEVIGTDKDKKQIFVAKYTLDTSSKPWKISMTSTAPKEGKAVGLVEKNGDEIKLIYNLPGGEPPTQFKTKPNQQMFVLKNMKHGGDRLEK